MVDLDEFLFIEPKIPPSPEPIIDELTRSVTALFRTAINPTGTYYRGFHVCSCGACSDNGVHELPNGQKTNSLCIHYVAYHRNVLTRQQKAAILATIADCNCGEAEPTEAELAHPRRKA